MFSPTQPVSDGTRYQTTNPGSTQSFGDESVPATTAGPTTVHSTLSPSLREDLLRFADAGAEIELLPAIAASVRHARSVLMGLDLQGLRIVASIHPRQQIFRAPLDLGALSPAECRALKLVHVEPQGSVADEAGRDTSSGPLRPLLWRLAMHGPRVDLLPEVQGPVRYRLAFGAALRGLDIAPEFGPVLARLKSSPLGLGELVEGSGLGRDLLQRLLNALYLQSGLMIVRAFGTRG
jgi:hypothetical protein